MDNATLILRTLDGYLDHAVRLILYGRAALLLGFREPPKDVAESKDVDAIIPALEVEGVANDETFWDAQEKTNLELRPRGLYITHLFRSDQVFLRPDWQEHLVPIMSLQLRWLRLFRPATLDLILTKMMRGDDAQDMEDIAFMIRHDRITSEQIERAFTEVVIPDLLEFREAFEKAKPCVRKLAERGCE
jgi:hypothetical protein